MPQDLIGDADRWRARQDDFLHAATSVWNPASVLNLLCHLERNRREPGHSVRIADVDAACLTAWFSRIDTWRDCADFDVLRLVHVWRTWRDALPQAARDALAERLAGFKYWYTEPTPDGVVDHRWYWSENHRLIFHTIEYLAGEAFPDRRFGTDGRPGAEHREDARRKLDAWFDEKARYGFSEWHSDVYYEKDLAPLLTLAELAGDPALADRAATFLDLLLFDVALHVHRGNMGATHGRSYMKDKSQGPDQPMFGAVKLCFGGTDLAWPVDDGDAANLTPLDEGVVLLSIARRYRPPDLLARVASASEPMTDREGMGVDLDPEEPFRDDPVRDDGLSYTDAGMVPFWWDRGALTAWQVVPATIATMDRHRLWDADLFAPFRAARELTGGDPEVTKRLAHAMAPMLNAGLLARVDTCTYRTRHVMLSTAQSYRPGRSGFQQHAWQATLDERAVVFTTHPANEPWSDPATFHDLDHYWTGSATLPRSAQHGAMAIHIYVPGYAPPEIDALAVFRYLPFTHAYFPTERFDEVERSGNWTLGGKDGAYVALWSRRTPSWRTHDPSEVCTNHLTEPFDLVAEGGPENVWVVEVGDVDRWGSFDAFRRAILGARIEADFVPPEGDRPATFDVAYDSPGEGAASFSTTGPLVVDGEERAISGYPRFDNPWSRVEQGTTVVEIRDGSGSLQLDLMAGTRTELPAS